MLNIETFDINDSSCKNYSIEFSNLIEFVKKLRSLTKTAKFHIIKLLNMKMNKLKLKLKVKGGEPCNKLKNKEDEIDFLEKADLDTLAKRIFANRYTSNDLEKLGDRLSLEDRIVVRLFTFKNINKEIMDFRSQHLDWEELVDVVLYKNTCGKMKVNKASKKNSKIVSIPLSYGIPENKVIKDENKNIYVTPTMKTEKSNSEVKEYKKRQNESKFVEKKAVLRDQKKTNKNIEMENNIPVEKFYISDEQLAEFIKNQDDLDEWEKEENSPDEFEEFNLMKPLNFSENKNETKKDVKHFSKHKKFYKRKSSFKNKPNPKISKSSY